jgi:hypothetical protein
MTQPLPHVKHALLRDERFSRCFDGVSFGLILSLRGGVRPLKQSPHQSEKAISAITRNTNPTKKGIRSSFVPLLFFTQNSYE